MISSTDRCLRFGQNAIILILLIILTDQVIGRIIRHFYFTQESGLYYRTTFAIDSTNADILVFGSSRANHHYVPEVFEDSLGLSFYNSGRDGNFLLFNYAVFKSIVRRYTPKILLFDVNPDELNYEKTDYERLSALFPYYKNHNEIRSTVELKSPFEKYKLISEIYPFNSSLITIIIGNLELNKSRKTDKKGYVPLENQIKDPLLHKIEPPKNSIDENKMNAISDIIKYCNTNNIRLIFIQSPMFAIVGKTTSSEYFEKVAWEKKAIFWNFINDQEFLHNPEYFQDQDHLNDKGAILFSKLVAQKINDLQTFHPLTLIGSKEMETTSSTK